MFSLSFYQDRSTTFGTSTSFFRSKGMVMAFNENLKNKSDKNWQCVELLRGHQPGHFDVATSRLYYSIFLLLKSNMVENQKNENKSDVATMAATAATGSHKLVLQYYECLNDGNGKPLRELQDLRNIADYEPKPVTKEAFERNWAFWTKWRKDFLSTN